MGVFKKYKDKYSGSHFNRLRRNRLHNGQRNYVSNPFSQFNNMAMKLTDREKGFLDGQQGEAARMALSSLLDLGELFGAEEMI